MNRVTLIGRLGTDPETKKSANGPVCRFALATSEKWKSDGESHERTEWHRVVVFHKLAEVCAKYLQKGSRVFLEGRIQTRSWESESGEKKYATEIIAMNIQFLDAKPQQEKPKQPKRSKREQEDFDQIPF